MTQLDRFMDEYFGCGIVKEEKDAKNNDDDEDWLF